MITEKRLDIKAPSLRHLQRMTDDVGIVQHASSDIPNRATGYCTDDVARALIVAIAAQGDAPGEAERLEAVYLGFLAHAQLSDGRFHNFMSYERTWLDDVGDNDSIGRAIWALGYGERHILRTGRRAFARELFDRAIDGSMPLRAMHSNCFAALGLVQSYLARGRSDVQLAAHLEQIGELLMRGLSRERTATWHWFQSHMTYDCARMPEALLRIGAALDKPSYIAAGIETLHFYRDVVLGSGMFVPIGSNGWYPRDSVRAVYPQQPLEAAAFIDAAAVAYSITADPIYYDWAVCAYEWFSGQNMAKTSLLFDGGCADGIDEDNVNRNMGAESTLSYLAATYTMRTFGHRFSVTDAHGAHV